MRIIDIIKGERPSLSFEVFPPGSPAKYEEVLATAEAIASLKPSYMSVTYGAGGGNHENAIRMAADIQRRFQVPSLAHLCCVAADSAQIQAELVNLRQGGVENILALRGDIPARLNPADMHYHYASELIREIRAFGDFCIGGACYPESHPESPSSMEDIRHLKEKTDCGCEFLTTQMFFDNNILYNFMYRIREAGITVPVVAGIMPVTNPRQLRRIMSISGTALPQRFVRIVERYGDNPEAMKQAGIAYATEQIIDLYANGINAVHVYSMNKADVAAKIQSNLSAIIGSGN